MMPSFMMYYKQNGGSSGDVLAFPLSVTVSMTTKHN